MAYDVVLLQSLARYVYGRRTVAPKVLVDEAQQLGDRQGTEQKMTTRSAATGTTTAAATGTGRTRTVRPAAVTCSWCGAEVDVPVKGRVPKWCGTSCRHRAWEQRRAAESGRSAVDVIERIVERVVTVQLPAPAPQVRPQPAVVATAAATPTGAAWAPLLTELARQLDTGRIYTRDLNTILPTFDEALQALNRRLQH